MSDEQKEKLIAAAKNLIGKPYKYGTKPEEAPDFFDCSSFTQYIFKQIGIDVPRSTILQAVDSSGKEIVPEPNFSNLEIGDLLFMRGIQGYYNDEAFGGRKIYVGHVGIYIGNNKVIHARFSLNAVAEQDINELTGLPNCQIVLVKRFF